MPRGIDHALFSAVSARLAEIDQAQMEALLAQLPTPPGWGATHVLPLGRDKVFVKRIPLTALEHEALFSTRNLFELPLFYNYGIGSAGFGAFRELVAHLKTTNWALDGSCANFPLLYHYRIVPFRGVRPPRNEEWHERFVRYWNSDPHIDAYLRARAVAPYEIMLFLEYLPDVLAPWLLAHPGEWEGMLREMQHTLTFLRTQGIVHFDVHFHNIVIRGRTPCLTDFGLVLDRSFDLGRDGHAFWRRHRDYDAAEFLCQVGAHLYSRFRTLSPRRREQVARRYGIADEKDYSSALPTLVRHLDDAQADPSFALDPHFCAAVRRYLPIIETMTAFYQPMQQGDRKDTPYPAARIARLLEETGYWRT